MTLISAVCKVYSGVVRWYSLYFNLFAANMLESKSFEVELKDAEPDIIEQLVEFAYTAR